MKKYFFALLLVLLFFNSIYPQNIEIKSLKYYPGNDQAGFPLIGVNGSGQKLTIEFDIKDQHIPDISIVFRFCDMNWKSYDNLFLSNFGKNIARNLNLEKLPTTVREADYHFKGAFPDANNYVEFPFSGNWMFFITDVQDTSIVYGHGKFYVIENVINIQDTLSRLFTWSFTCLLLTILS